ncbi:MAG: galactokinase [Clostridiales bacterium]|jgi:galactokinase|nr:galactokinase [Clostridiales bacterium]
MTHSELKERFARIYGGRTEDVRLFSAAGRINIIGEHIDYCGGPVLPAALNLRCLVAARKNGGNVIRLAATTIDKRAELDIGRLDGYRKLEWGEYQAGVAYVMQNDGYNIVGCDLLYDCDVPFGSGLSSSAAIEVATAYTLSTFSGEAGCKTGDNVALALLSQRAENEYAGVNCGIMDQFASAMGKKGNAIFLDCATLKYEYVSLDLGGYAMVIANSNKKRSLQESKYNERRAEVTAALELLQTRLPRAKNLADVSVGDFEGAKGVLSGKILDRARHVVYECDRVKRSVAAMRRGDIAELGRLLNESHYSLRDLYEVTGKELDALTNFSRGAAGCIGSRMTGAGFGGCAVSLVQKDRVAEFVDSVGKLYKAATGLDAAFYDAFADDGAFEIRV